MASPADGAGAAGAQIAASIVDGANNGGNPHFFFLPPLRPMPSAFNGAFDATLAPTVEICLPAQCGTAALATYTRTSGEGSEVLRVDVPAEQYIVNWHTGRFDLDPALTYRIRVLVNGQVLGYADVDVVSRGSELKRVDTGEFIPLLDGRTLPIKFRIEAGAVSEPGFSGVETRITTNGADQMDPAISGDIIVYTDYRGADADIWYYNLVTGVETRIATTPGDQMLNDVSGNLIVFDDYVLGDVFAFNVATGTLTNLTQNLGSGTGVFEPAVGGTIVAWASAGDIYARDLATGTDRRLSNSSASDRAPAVNDRTVVWTACNPTCHIWAYDWDSDSARQLTTGTDDERDPDVWGTKVVFASTPATGSGSDIVLFDLATNTSTRLVRDGEQMNPNISGDFVAFEDLSSGISRIALWHLPTNSVIDPQINPGSAQFLNDIDGNRVVYTDNRNGQYDIYLFEFTMGAPAVPTITPTSGAPGSTFTIYDPQGRMQAGDMAIFYVEGSDPALGLPAESVVVSADGKTMTGKVPAIARPGTLHYVSVRSGLNFPSRFNDLAFLTTA